MMSFMVYFLLKNPEAMRKLRVEIDQVVGDRPVQYEDMSKLLYLNGDDRSFLITSRMLH
jgi:cytochrome P450/NADPH-cytochrome P450 reductase